MAMMSTDRTRADDAALVERARSGDEGAYRDLVQSYRAELQAHCYRMLGSYHDAEDALQDALVRAWRGLPGFESRSSVRAWLYKIATNSALNVARRRSRRELPASRGPAVRTGEGAGTALLEEVWLEPYPDQDFVSSLGISPEARYEQRENLELAFIAAVQFLPPLQRAVLMLRHVLGFSAQEVAEQLGTSVPAVTSALQRARAGVEARVPERSQQATLRSIGDKRARELVEAYADAIERADAPALVRLLTEDAILAMPPLPGWYYGQAAIKQFVSHYGLNERWRHLPTFANGQLALGCYTLDTESGCYVASALDVLRLEGEQVAESVYFLTAEILRRWGADEAPSTLVGAGLFPRFGLPATLD
jgi:RNA polymerase sigma-70 factor, ECF subfamily